VDLFEISIFEVFTLKVAWFKQPSFYVVQRASYRHPTLQKWELPDSIDVYL
jgi:hypothetical protein